MSSSYRLVDSIGLCMILLGLALVSERLCVFGLHGAIILLCGPLRVPISWNGADVCLSVCLSVTCHISKAEPDRAIVTMDHYIEVGCN